MRTVLFVLWNNEALGQKSLAAEKIQIAKDTDSIITLAIDFCQNLDIPRMGQDQPGGTYYLSPI